MTDLFGAPNCTFERVACSTVLLLHGWLQHPILPSFPPGETPTYTISYDEHLNPIVLEVRRPLDEARLPGPGVRQVHFMLLGSRNPEEPGNCPIHVANSRSGRAIEAGGIRGGHDPAAVTPSLNVTSI